MKTHFKIFVRNETRYWNPAIVRKAGHAIYRAYLFDSLRQVHACELTPSYEMFPLYTTPWKDDEEGNVDALIRQEETGEPIYIHCHTIDNLPAGHFYDRGEEEHPDDEDWDEIRERMDEHYQGNVMIQFPQGLTVPEITYRFTDQDLKSEWKKDANWQVVFKIRNADGIIRDYCRETRIRSIETLEEVEQWTIEQCRIHNLCGAEIQLF
jgi:hypothetical protein